MLSWTDEHERVVVDRWRALWAARSPLTVSEWCGENLVFAEPENSGPFSFAGREYIREPLDAFGDPTLSDQVLVFGSQAGKTGMLMGGVAWSAVNNPVRCMWVMPNRDKAGSFSRKRWLPMLRNSKPFEGLIPTGARRHEFATMSQMVGSAIIDFQGSNSPTNLSSDPCSWVIQDETDKFNEGTKSEADASDLADQRTKGQSLPKRVKTSTPTVEEGLIWQAFRKTDMRRYWVPCPHCGERVLLVWSAQFSTFPVTGSEAEVQWEGRTLDEAAQSARFVCPHCQGHIRDEHKRDMDKAGEWRPSNPDAASGMRGWHLPSLYASTPETQLGKLVIKFLNAKNSLLGLQGFINGDLAEPFVNQDTRSERVEVVTDSLGEDKQNEEPVRLMAVDCQGKAPFFWHVVREYRGGDSLAIACGPLDSWEEVEEAQKAHNVPDAGMIVDSGYGAKSDAEVYRNCARHCEVRGRFAVGWMPAKGFPGRKRWRDTKTGLSVPWRAVPIDPFIGTAQASQISLDLFEFSGDAFKDVLESLRAGKGESVWAVSPAVDTDEYWRHMDGEVKTRERSPKTGLVTYTWRPRSRHWPNHMLDCEVMLLAGACYMGLLQIDKKAENE